MSLTEKLERLITRRQALPDGDVLGALVPLLASENTEVRWGRDCGWRRCHT